METIFEIDDIEQPVPETKPTKPKKEPKIKKKKEMSEERRQALREQLSRGRATLAKKREAKKGGNKETEKKVPIKKEKPVKNENVKMEVEKVKPSSNNDDLRNEISELKKLILEGRKPREPPAPQPVKEKPEPVKEKPKEKLIQVLETPQLIQPPIPKKKKRSLLGGGIILNLDRF
tara:strand:- start:12 stop:539 length:528 start_codon:yes stop_codon:yes gene_type:complete